MTPFGPTPCHIRTVGLHRVERQSALADQGDEDLLLRPRPAVDVDEEERVTGKDVVRCVLVAIRPNAAAAEPAASDQPGGRDQPD